MLKLCLKKKRKRKKFTWQMTAASTVLLDSSALGYSTTLTSSVTNKTLRWLERKNVASLRKVLLNWPLLLRLWIQIMWLYLFVMSDFWIVLLNLISESQTVEWADDGRWGSHILIAEILQKHPGNYIILYYIILYITLVACEFVLKGNKYAHNFSVQWIFIRVTL